MQNGNGYGPILITPIVLNILVKMAINKSTYIPKTQQLKNRRLYACFDLWTLYCYIATGILTAIIRLGMLIGASVVGMMRVTHSAFPGEASAATRPSASVGAHGLLLLLLRSTLPTGAVRTGGLDWCIGACVDASCRFTHPPAFLSRLLCCFALQRGWNAICSWTPARTLSRAWCCSARS